MKLEFDSVSDLQQFLNWVHVYSAPRGSTSTTVYLTGGGSGAGGVTSTGAISVGAGGASGTAGAALDTPFPKIDTAGVTFDTPQSALKGDHVALMDGAQPGGGHVEPGAASGDKSPEGGEPVNAAGKPLRKRRTKAELAADEKATADALLAKQNNNVAAGLVQEANAVDGKAAEGPATPSGTNPFEQVAEAADGAAGDAEGVEVPNAEADAAVTPFLHLTRAREFIAKHGMPKYNESFAKAGLDPNVTGYNAEQRAQHMATLAELDKA